MTWDITDRFPDWGETGESPPTGFFYEGGDQVNEKHLDYLWNSVKGLEDDVQSALNDIDSDGDGTVDKADSVVGGTGNEYTDSDAVSAVDGEVDNASTSVAGLDDAVAGKSDKGHDHTEASETQIPDSGLVEDYVTSAESGSYTDADAISAVDGEVNNAATTVAGLDDAVAGKAEDTELYSDSEAVSAVDGEVDNAASSVAGLDNVVSNTAPDNHDNSAHSTNYLPESNDANIGSNTSVSGNVDFQENEARLLSKIDSTGGSIDFSQAAEIIVSTGTFSLGDSFDTDLVVTGDATVNGNKPFVIPHPTDDTKNLRHCAYEGPVSGGLIYRDQVEVVNGEASVDFPDYVTNGDFGADWIQSVTPKKHFGTGYLDTDTWTVKADSDGTYDVVLMGQRTDSQGLAGLGGITTKDKDESWDEAADRFYGGADDVDGNEIATSNDEYKQTTLYAHAKSQHESN